MIHVGFIGGLTQSRVVSRHASQHAVRAAHHDFDIVSCALRVCASVRPFVSDHLLGIGELHCFSSGTSEDLAAIRKQVAGIRQSAVCAQAASC